MHTHLPRDMSRTLIYSCVFFNESYAHLVYLLLKSYVLFGDVVGQADVRYLVVCNPSLQGRIQAMYDELQIDGEVWCLDLHTKFEAGCARLAIFDYPDIDHYDRILYLDCDILVTHALTPLLSLALAEDKLYALKEGRTTHEFWGKDLFTGEGLPNPETDAFTSGILLFRQSQAIRHLFTAVRAHIKAHLEDARPIPVCLDQPFLCYHAIKNNAYDNESLIGLVVNNPTRFAGEAISHFPGGPGNYESKVQKMTRFLAERMQVESRPIPAVTRVVYEEILQANQDKFDHLYQLCKDSGEPVEGNCFTQHLNVDNVLPSLVYKQMNHFSLGRVSNRIMEIGFNAGHSSLLYLLSNPSATLTVFDLCEHAYTRPCFEYLASEFPGRITLHAGDSTQTVPTFHQRHPDVRFDLVHIDGAHFGDIPDKDFRHSLPMAADIIVWDDTQITALDELLNGYLREGLVYEIFLHATQVYKHRICRIRPALHPAYSWEASVIRFLGEGQMDAFGAGTYTFVDTHLVQCDFGGRSHLLHFDEDMERFVSVRRGDLDVRRGERVSLEQ